MNTFGLHALVLVSDWDERGAERAIRSAAAIGYDLVETPIFDPASVDLVRTRDLLRQNKLIPSVSLGLTPETDISSADQAISAAGINQLHKIVDATAFIGGSVVAGVIASAWQKYLAPPTDAGYRNAVSGIREVAREARGKGVTIAVEVVNRFEFEPLEYGRPGPPFRRRGRRGQCRHSPRHLPHAYRGGGRRGGDPRLRFPSALFPRQRKPPWLP